MTCKDSCLCFDVCSKYGGKLFKSIAEDHSCDKCPNLKDKSRFIELPCNIGDTLYDILEFVEHEKNPTLVKNKVDKITIAKGRTGFIFIINGLGYYPSDFGVNVFTDLIEATEKVKELKE